MLEQESYGYFNPRTHRGVRQIATIILQIQRLNFNPRTHRGVRHFEFWFCVLQNTYFNPRTHRGVRPSAINYLPQTDKFQSTHPSWGATRLSQMRS